MNILFKKCCTCKEEKPFYLFNVDKNSEDGRFYYCKGCIPRKKEKGTIRGYTVCVPYPTLENPILEPVGKERERIKNKLPWNRMISNLSKRLKRIKDRKNIEISSPFGCSYKELKKYIESQFNSGMTWDNYGKLWEIDHIKPVHSFDKSELNLVNLYLNLQPLLKEDHKKKSKKERKLLS